MNDIVIVANSDMQRIVQNKYGLLPAETDLLMTLNDVFKFTFQDFAEILRRAPKSYGLEPSQQRLKDSIQWMNDINYMRSPGFRVYYPSACACKTCRESNRSFLLENAIENKINYIKNYYDLNL